ncbi:hypothetical protein V1512DRAFT_266283 [Lipomyces arxii]|uniref:uncharacterized protein n=1 Tax=Lipomyces arxii TaxID=56418 RepID=UPI0034CF4089
MSGFSSNIVGLGKPTGMIANPEQEKHPRRWAKLHAYAAESVVLVHDQIYENEPESFGAKGHHPVTITDAELSNCTSDEMKTDSSPSSEDLMVLAYSYKEKSSQLALPEDSDSDESGLDDNAIFLSSDAETVFAGSCSSTDSLTEENHPPQSSTNSEDERQLMQYLTNEMAQVKQDEVTHPGLPDFKFPTKPQPCAFIGPDYTHINLFIPDALPDVDITPFDVHNRCECKQYGSNYPYSKGFR